jgi:hypothetical protein
MRLYVIRGEINIGNGDEDKALKVVGTQTDARSWLRKNKPEYRNIYWEELDVPTDKAGLIEFLNKHTYGRDDI